MPACWFRARRAAHGDFAEEAGPGAAAAAESSATSKRRRSLRPLDSPQLATTLEEESHRDPTSSKATAWQGRSPGNRVSLPALAGSGRAGRAAPGAQSAPRTPRPDATGDFSQKEPWRSGRAVPALNATRRGAHARAGVPSVRGGRGAGPTPRPSPAPPCTPGPRGRGPGRRGRGHPHRTRGRRTRAGVARWNRPWARRSRPRKGAPRPRTDPPASCSRRTAALRVSLPVCRGLGPPSFGEPRGPRETLPRR